MAGAAKHLTPVTLELGGKSPVIVADDANAARSRPAGSPGPSCSTPGQTCVAPDYVLVDRTVRDSFVDELNKALDSFSARAGRCRSSTSARPAGIAGLVEKAGGRTVRGGKVDADGKRAELTVIVDPDADSALMREEIFGPVLPIVTVDSMDDAIAHVQQGPKPLALYLFSESRANEKRVLDEISNGGTVVNQPDVPPARRPNCPSAASATAAPAPTTASGASRRSATASRCCASPPGPTRRSPTRRSPSSSRRSCARSSDRCVSVRRATPRAARARAAASRISNTSVAHSPTSCAMSRTAPVRIVAIRPTWVAADSVSTCTVSFVISSLLDHAATSLLESRRSRGDGTDSASTVAGPASSSRRACRTAQPAGRSCAQVEPSCLENRPGVVGQAVLLAQRLDLGRDLRVAAGREVREQVVLDLVATGCRT